MKKIIFIALISCSAVSSMLAQDISRSQVPSVILNKFQQEFPKAVDIDWQIQGELYKVDFEIGPKRIDHDIWYTREGKVSKHKKEISKQNLPAPVMAKIKSDFPGFRISDTKQITEGNKVIYSLELNKLMQEWKMTFDPEGNILSQVAD